MSWLVTHVLCLWATRLFIPQSFLPECLSRWSCFRTVCVCVCVMGMCGYCVAYWAELNTSWRVPSWCIWADHLSKRLTGAFSNLTGNLPSRHSDKWLPLTPPSLLLWSEAKIESVTSAKSALGYTKSNRHLMFWLESMCEACSLCGPVYCLDKHLSW